MALSRPTLVCVLLLVSALVPQAHAGSRDDPEVRSESCEPEVVQVRGEYTVCKAWFTAPPASDDEGSVTGTLQVAASLEDRLTPVRTALTWGRADKCREGWEFTDLVDGRDQLLVLRQCGDGPLITAALEPDRAVVEGAEVTVELDEKDLELVGSSLPSGARLSRPIASTRFVVRSSAGLVELTTLGGDAGPGRDFVMPS